MYKRQEYTSILFASYTVTNEDTVIKDQYSTQRDIEFTNDNTILSIEREGQQVGLDSLVEWDVLNVLLPKNYSEQSRNSIEIYVTVEPVGGEIESINDDELVVSGIEYKISKSYQDAVDAGYAPVSYTHLQ